jgi:aspartate kinase
VRAARHPAQQIFGADDGEGERPRGAVDGGGDERTAGAHESRRRGEKDRGFSHMLDDFQRQHRIEALVGSELLDCRRAIVDREPGFRRMRPRRFECRDIGVDRRDGKAHPRHWLGDETAAAADVEEAQTGKRAEGARIAGEVPYQPVANEADARRIDPVQRPELALGIPPRMGQPGEPLDLVGVDRALGGFFKCYQIAAPQLHGIACLAGAAKSMNIRPVAGNAAVPALSRLGPTSMARIVQKFGGTSVANIERIKAVARRVKREVDAGNEVAAVVSAMAGTTDQLVQWTRETSQFHDAREYDTVVASGEQITAGLLALALQELGINARSWLGWQVPIRTDGIHGKARIIGIDIDLLQRRIGEGQVAVVAGFQGLGPDNRITTLGRGGSDTSAVALAAALGADRCDIFTDVDGVYTTDPRIVAKARKLDRITYEEMLELASLGAKVLQTRSVEMAMNHRVRVQVLSSFADAPGTLVVDEDEIVEKQVVSGIAYSRDEAKITLLKVADRPGVAAAIFGPLADHAINVDMIVQNISEDGRTTDLTFTVAKADLDRAVKVLEERRAALGYAALKPDSNVVKISVIGIGMRSHVGIAQLMFQTLAEKGINIQVISTSEIKVSVLVAEEYTELAVRALHTAYGLDAS